MAVTVKSLDDSVGMLARIIDGGYTKHTETSPTSGRTSASSVYTITENDCYANIAVRTTNSSYNASIYLLDSNNNLKFTLLSTTWFPVYSSMGGFYQLIDLRGLAGYKLKFDVYQADFARSWADIYTKGGSE